MLAALFTEWMLRLALASSAAIALVLLLRRPMRTRFGAASAYQAWLILPVMLAAALLPPLQNMPPPVLVVLNALPGAATPAMAPHASTDWSSWLLMAWASGALATLACFVLEHRRFVQRLGTLTPQDKALYSATGAEGPLLLGLWRPKLVLPGDFAQRYSAGEQALIVAHERAHASRRDPAANAVFTLLQCCFWFNPLLHLAAPRFRMDQELACDATVMAAHPGNAQAYASAMLKSQLDGAETLASCHWQSNHPLKERIMNLQQTPLAPSRRLAGHLAIGLLVLAGAGATLLARADAAPPAGKGARYAVNMTLTALGTTSKPRLHVFDGEMFRVGKGNDQQQWDGDFVLTAKGDGKLLLTSKLALNGQPMGEQSALMELGQTSTIGVSMDEGKTSFTLDMVVAVLPPVAAK